MDNLYKFYFWLAASPVGVAFKVALAAAGGWFVTNVDTLGLPPVVGVALVPAVVILIDALNPADGRFGVGNTEPQDH